MREFLRWCDDLGIRVVTLYLLSTDNLDEPRPATSSTTSSRSSPTSPTTSRGGATGGCSTSAPPRGCPPQLVETCGRRGAHASNTGLHVNLAVGYGGRREIADAMRSIVRKHGEGGGTLDELAEILTPELIGEHLYTRGQPDPDLVIRTSGEQRLSDFMLWQSAHSEFYFVEALGPDLREVDFLRALRDYANAASGGWGQ